MFKFLLSAAAVVTAAAIIARQRQGTAPGWQLPEGWDIDIPTDWPERIDAPDQLSSAPEIIWNNLSLDNLMPDAVTPDQAARNVRAFLDVIAHAEGADYNVLFGGDTFDSFRDHPRQYITRFLGGREITSSAAGRYQFLARTWDGLVAKMRLPDFSPASQDAGAIELIREKGALRDVQAGRFAVAVRKVRKVWASLPGAGYNQPERSLSSLARVYAQAGGSTEA